MSASNNAGFNTRAVHAGQAFEPVTGAVVPPLHFSTTYAQDGIGNLRSGYEYGRGGNPTRDAFKSSLPPSKVAPRRSPSAPAWPLRTH